MKHPLLIVEANNNLCYMVTQ